jgi:hypothetical protein
MLANECELAHREVVSVGMKRAQHEHALSKALLRALRADCHRALGMGSFYEYAERYAGLTSRQTDERLRVGTAFEELPRLEQALATARLQFSAVRELTRVATPETETAWIEAAHGKTIREVEELTSGHEPGDLPDDPPDLQPRRHRIVLEVSPETYASFREAQAKLRRDSDGHLTEDETLLLLSRNTLLGPSDPGTSSYQVRMNLCGACGRVSQDAAGLVIAVDPTVAEVALCDAQVLRPGKPAAQAVPPSTRRDVVRRHHGRCGVNGCRNATFTQVHHTTLRSEGGTHDPERLILLCSAHHDAVHRGSLIIEGAWSSGFRFLHADGGVYGTPVNPARAVLLADVFQALCSSGFPEGQARRLVNRVIPHVGEGATLDEALRLAFRASQDATMAP